MESIGSKLVEEGWISDQQLAEALTRQQELGGRVGTALLELDAVSEDLLLKALGEQRKAPIARVADLKDVPADVIALLPGKVARKYFAIPFRAEHGHIDVAMRSLPDMGRLDELSFILDRRVVVHLANESRVYEALEKYYGHVAPSRFGSLLARLNQRRNQLRGPSGAAANAAPAPVVAAAAPASAARPSRPAPTPTGEKKPAPPAPTSVPLSAEEKQSLRSAPAVESIQPLSLDGVSSSLQKAASTDEIGRAALGYLSQEFLRALLFRADAKTVRGWMGRSPNFDAYRFRQFSVGFDEPSIFLNLLRGGEFFLGALPPMPAHQRLVELWKGDLTHECALFPLRVRKRLVAVLYGDRDSLGLTGLDVRGVQRLAAKAAIAFEMLIMRKKLAQP